MIRIGTVFSGIGSPEQALAKLGIDHQIIFAGDIDKYCKKTYFANYPITGDQWHDDVIQFDATPYKDQIDLLVGGSPCQSFSVCGQLRGLEDTRGTLFFEFARIVDECQPKAFIYENVSNLLTHDNGQTFEIIKKTFDQLGYHIHYKVLNSKDYGVPQSRGRLFIVGFKDDREFVFPDPVPLEKTAFDLLDDDVDPKYFISDRYLGYILGSGTKGFTHKPETDKAVACTILSTMYKMHRAGIDNYYHQQGRLRKLTPREALRFMGFPESFKIVCSDTQTYRQAGNAMVVDVIAAIIKKIIEAL